MASKKQEPRNTPWRAELWARRYRGASIWVEEMFSTAPKWNWCTEWDGEGRSASKQAAMRVAMKAIDAALTKGNPR